MKHETSPSPGKKSSGSLFVYRMMAVLAPFVLAVISQTSLALLVTCYANATNTLGLGWLVLFLWFAVAFLLALTLWRILTPPSILLTVLTAPILSYVLYLFVGVRVFHWSGLLKNC